jgi:hypothetical protein
MPPPDRWRTPAGAPQGVACRSSTRRDPPTLLRLTDDARLPRWQRVSIGMDHQIRRGLRVSGDAYYEHGGSDFRSTDLNAGSMACGRIRPSAACYWSSRSARLPHRSQSRSELLAAPGILQQPALQLLTHQERCRRCPHAAAVGPLRHGVGGRAGNVPRRLSWNIVCRSPDGV